MQDPQITTHRSLKQQLKKSKERTRTLSQVKSERVNLNIGINNFDESGGESQQSIEDSDNSDAATNKRTRHFPDVPVIDFMTNKVEAVLASYSNAMRSAIGDQITHSKNKDETNRKEEDIDEAQKKKKLNNDKKKRLLKLGVTVELDVKKEAKIVELLNESETYLEKNLNAAANNMSILTLHTFEFTDYMEQQKTQ